MLTRFTVVIISQCIKISNHVVHLKTNMLYVKYTSKKQQQAYAFILGI